MATAGVAKTMLRVVQCGSNSSSRHLRGCASRLAARAPVTLANSRRSFSSAVRTVGGSRASVDVTRTSGARTWLHHAASGSRVGGVRHMGLLDSFQASLDSRKADKMEEKKQELFTAQVTFIADCDAFTMDKHVTMVRDVAAAMGLSGWRAKMRSSASQAELLEKYPELLVADALRPEDIADETSIKRKEKRRIATEAGVGVDIVNRFLRAFEANKMMHRFVHTRKAKGLPLPKTQEEYSKMLATTPSAVRGRDARKQFGRVRSGRAALSRNR